MVQMTIWRRCRSASPHSTTRQSLKPRVAVPYVVVWGVFVVCARECEVDVACDENAEWFDCWCELMCVHVQTMPVVQAFEEEQRRTGVRVIRIDASQVICSRCECKCSVRLSLVCVEVYRVGGRR